MYLWQQMWSEVAATSQIVMLRGISVGISNHLSHQEA